MSDSSAVFSLFSPVGRIPHGVCLTWDPTLVWTLAASHLLVGLAYMTIPVALFVFMRRQKGLQFTWMFGLFGTFIFACGTTHFISLMNIWQPHYGLEAVVMAITAVVSVATAATLVPLIPIASRFIDEKTETELQLQKMNLDLQDQMERFFDLAVAQRASQAELLTVQDASPVGMFRTGADGACTYVNRTYENICGQSAATLMGNGWIGTMHPEDLQRVAAEWRAATTAVGPFASRYRMRKPDGETVYISGKSAPVMVDGKLIGYVGSIEDVTALHEADLALKVQQQAEEARLRALLRTDSLTGLGNRAGFEQALQSTVDRRRRGTRQAGPKPGLAVLFADLDHLKRVNDSLGHATGDLLIQGFANRLRDSLRVTDYCARLGGDEFTVVLENIYSLADAELLCEKLLDEIRRPFLLDNTPHSMTASFGVACHFGSEDADGQALLKEADRLLYLAKQAGRNTYRVHALV
ncbi:MAG: sensor domain-containing diguanylate cyclase [Stagnimonas sp.]|nr:sensor domain-containing diguanylate cyclase [Stagnimonas sp.]